MASVTIYPPARPLAAGLPYNRIVTSNVFSEVPDRLRYKFKYSLAESTDGNADSPTFTIEEPTAKLAGKTLAVSFKPATKADEDIIASKLPKPDANGNIDPNALPTSLPGYLINLTTQFTVDGQVVAQGNIGTMGSEIYEELGFYDVAQNTQRLSVNHPTAGEYRAIGLDLQGTNPEKAARLKAKLEKTKAALESQDTIALNGLTKHELIGDLLYATIYNYFALNDVLDKVDVENMAVTNFRAPSFGIFSTLLKTEYWYGLPRNVKVNGLRTDIDQAAYQAVSNVNNPLALIAYIKASGARLSAMESLVPERDYSDESHRAIGISAVKALALAEKEGQKIWTIDSSNVDLALNNIVLSPETEVAIRNSVAAGKVVSTRSQQINFNGWVGEGFITTDPATGAGAYQISGGANGADTLGFVGTILNVLNQFSGVFQFIKESPLLMKLFGPIVGAIGNALQVLSYGLKTAEACGDSPFVGTMSIFLEFAIMSFWIGISVILMPLSVLTFAFWFIIDFLVGKLVQMISELAVFYCRSMGK